MLRLLSLFSFFIILSTSLKAQNDSIPPQEAWNNIKIPTQINAVDSIGTHSLDSINRLTYKAEHLADSLHPDLKKYNNKVTVLKARLQHKVDSLQKLRQPTIGYSHLLDSLQKSGPVQDIKKAEAKVASLETSISAPVTKINASVSSTTAKVNSKLSLISQEGGADANVPGNLNVPQLQTGLPMLPTASNVNTPSVNSGGVSGGLNLPSANIPGLSGNPTAEINKVTTSPMPQIKQVPGMSEVGKVEQDMGKAKGYSQDAQHVVHGDLNGMQQAPKALEGKAMQMGEMKDLKTETQQIDQYKKMAGNGDEAAVKQFAKSEIQKEAFNHFGGREKELQAAMSKLSEYKKKYGSLSSILDAGKVSRNEMHGKPFIERLVPGVTLQFMFKDHTVLDVNPQVGYKFTGRIMTGGGWNERIAFGHSHQGNSSRVFGPRTFGEYTMGRGFIVRMDVEAMNIFIPAGSQTNTDPSSRQWTWGVMAGLKKEYKLGKHIRGNVQTMYNFLDHRYNASPYPDRFNIRMGFEFPMKKKVKTTDDKNNSQSQSQPTPDHEK